MKLWDKFDKASDKGRWELIILNPEEVVVILDNDATYVRFVNEEDGEWHEFNNYIGNGDGLYDLFSALCIESEGV